MVEFVEGKITQSINDRKNLNSRFSKNCATYNTFLELQKKHLARVISQRNIKNSWLWPYLL